MGKYQFRSAGNTIRIRAPNGPTDILAKDILAWVIPGGGKGAIKFANGKELPVQLLPNTGGYVMVGDFFITTEKHFLIACLPGETFLNGICRQESGTLISFDPGESGTFPILNKNARVRGNTGIEKVGILAGVMGVAVDKAIDHIFLPNNLGNLLFKQDGTQLRVYTSDKQLMATIEVNSGITMISSPDAVDLKVTLVNSFMKINELRVPFDIGKLLTPFDP